MLTLISDSYSLLIGYGNSKRSKCLSTSQSIGSALFILVFTVTSWSMMYINTQEHYLISELLVISLCIKTNTWSFHILSSGSLLLHPNFFVRTWVTRVGSILSDYPTLSFSVLHAFFCYATFGQECRTYNTTLNH